MVILFLIVSMFALTSMGQDNLLLDLRDDNRQLQNHLRHLAEDVSTMLTYFEMDNASLVGELTQQVALLKEQVLVLSENCRQQSTRGPARTTTVSVPRPVRTLPTLPPLPDDICGDSLRPVRMSRVPRGWVMCYQYASSNSDHTIGCNELLVNLRGGYADSARFLAAGGNFGCWGSSTGISGVQPYYACRPMMQQNLSFRSCKSCDIIGVCIQHPVQ